MVDLYSDVSVFRHRSFLQVRIQWRKAYTIYISRGCICWSSEGRAQDYRWKSQVYGDIQTFKKEILGASGAERGMSWHGRTVKGICR